MKVKENIAAVVLIAIAAGLIAVGLGSVFGSGAVFGSHSKQTKRSPAYDVKHCATLETSGLKICTKTDIVKQAATATTKCVAQQDAKTCAGELAAAIQDACKRAKGAPDACSRDSIRIIAVVESALTGESVQKVLKTVGISQRP